MKYSRFAELVTAKKRLYIAICVFSAIWFWFWLSCPFWDSNSPSYYEKHFGSFIGIEKGFFESPSENIRSKIMEVDLRYLGDKRRVRVLFCIHSISESEEVVEECGRTFTHEDPVKLARKRGMNGFILQSYLDEMAKRNLMFYVLVALSLPLIPIVYLLFLLFDTIIYKKTDFSFIDPSQRPKPLYSTSNDPPTERGQPSKTQRLFLSPGCLITPPTNLNLRSHYELKYALSIPDPPKLLKPKSSYWNLLASTSDTNTETIHRFEKLKKSRWNLFAWILLIIIVFAYTILAHSVVAYIHLHHEPTFYHLLVIQLFFHTFLSSLFSRTFHFESDKYWILTDRRIILLNLDGNRFNPDISYLFFDDFGVFDRRTLVVKEDLMDRIHKGGAKNIFRWDFMFRKTVIGCYDRFERGKKEGIVDEIWKLKMMQENAVSESVESVVEIERQKTSENLKDELMNPVEYCGQLRII